VTPAYPRPLVDDPRFDGGLILDLAKVIEAHGFPPITDATDLAGLQQSAFEFIFCARPMVDDAGDPATDATIAVDMIVGGPWCDPGGRRLTAGRGTASAGRRSDAPLPGPPVTSDLVLLLAGVPCPRSMRPAGPRTACGTRTRRRACGSRSRRRAQGSRSRGTRYSCPPDPGG
jgi:hypothetical protein